MMNTVRLALLKIFRRLFLLLLFLGGGILLLPAAPAPDPALSTPAQLREELLQYRRLLPQLPFSEKRRDQANFQLGRLVENLELIEALDPQLALGFARCKLGELYRFKTGYRNEADPKKLFADAYSGSFNLGRLDDRVFRNSQPSIAEFKWFFKHLGIKTVINLRKESDYWAGYTKADEEKLCREYGVVYKNYLLLDSDDPPPTKEQIEEVLKFIDQCGKPVMFHCAHGKGRTGMVAAAYRITRQGWSLENAIREARHYGFRPDLVPRQVKVLEQFQPKQGVKNPVR